MFDNLTRRRVALGRHWHFDLHADGIKFGELRPVESGWRIDAEHVEVAHCIKQRLSALKAGSSEAIALAAVREGIADMISLEDDVDETYSEETRAALVEYRQLRQEFDLDVDSDDVDTLRPIVDRLRAVERTLNLLPYVIGGAVYNGLGDD